MYTYYACPLGIYIQACAVVQYKNIRIYTYIWRKKYPIQLTHVHVYIYYIYVYACRKNCLNF